MAVEQPAYTLQINDGAFELRLYAPLVVAEVRVGGDMQDATNAGFRLLANYIFGGNRAQTRVAMTAPVTVSTGGGTRIAMTAPVTLAEAADAWIVQFSMPKQWTIDTLPVPNDNRVQLRPVPASRMAVLKFSGLTPAARVARKQSELASWVEKQGLTPAGSPSLARYDPPWTPWFLRRNEVMLPVAG